MLILSEEPGKLVSYFPEYFDKILIDAPCSGEGMFRKEKKMVKAWEEHGPEFFFKDPEKHCDTGSPDAASGWNAALFHLYIFTGRE